MPHFENIDDSLLLEECINDSSERLDRKKETIYKNWNIHQTFLIDAERLQIKELFTNILNNAYDAVKGRKGEIEVGLRSEGSGFIKIYFKIMVQD